MFKKKFWHKKESHKTRDAAIVFSFAAYLTSLDETVKFGKSENASPGAILSDIFCKHNGFGEPDFEKLKKIKKPYPGYSSRVIKKYA